MHNHDDKYPVRPGLDPAPAGIWFIRIAEACNLETPGYACNLETPGYKLRSIRKSYWGRPHTDPESVSSIIS